MKKYLVGALGVLTTAIVVIIIPNALAQTSEGIIRVSGADSMATRMQILTRVFTKNNTEIKVEVVQGELVDVGIADVIDNKADVAMASRSINDNESDRAVRKGVQLIERLVGYGGIVIVTNPENLVNDLSVEQVQKIFRGEITAGISSGAARRILQWSKRTKLSIQALWSSWRMIF